MKPQQLYGVGNFIVLTPVCLWIGGSVAWAQPPLVEAPPEPPEGSSTLEAVEELEGFSELDPRKQLELRGAMEQLWRAGRFRPIEVPLATGATSVMVPPVVRLQLPFAKPIRLMPSKVPTTVNPKLRPLKPLTAVTSEHAPMPLAFKPSTLSTLPSAVSIESNVMRAYVPPLLKLSEAKTVQAAIALSLAPHGAVDAKGAQAVLATAKLPQVQQLKPELRRAVADYWASIRDERAMPLYEELLMELEKPDPSWPTVAVDAVFERVTDHLTQVGENDRAARLLLRAS